MTKEDIKNIIVNNSIEFQNHSPEQNRALVYVDDLIEDIFKRTNNHCENCVYEDFSTHIDPCISCDNFSNHQLQF